MLNERYYSVCNRLTKVGVVFSWCPVVIGQYGTCIVGEVRSSLSTLERSVCCAGSLLYSIVKSEGHPPVMDTHGGLMVVPSSTVYPLQSQQPDVEDSQLIAYDRHHESKRKEQLEKLLNR